MKKEVVVERVVGDGGSESTASSAIWALAFVIIMAMLIGFVYYSGIWKKIRGGGTQKVDVTVSAPQ
jgi:hypothetical protein